ncbi:MAG TPA: histidine phosphatase family protein [Clostridiales bacterium]|nr:histidine phosphatase family protein [Clostridiales bacterium]
MELFIIRHGDPDYANDTLTEKGWEQAKRLSERMMMIKPDKIYSSPMGRAKDTAKPTCEKLGMTYNVEEWMAESMDYMHDPVIIKGEIPECSWETNFLYGVQNFRDFSSENRQHTLDRLPICSDDFLSRHGYIRHGLVYKAKEPNDDKIAVFCHGGFGGAWIAHLLSLPPAIGRLLFALETASVTKFVFQETANGYAYPKCIYLNSVIHLLK